MTDRLQEFLELSVCLTGFDRLQLMSTAMAEEYLRTLDTILPASLVDSLLTTYRSLPADGHETALSDGILKDPQLGPVARNVIVLWYSGTWKQLPNEWRAINGSSPLDDTHVVSSTAYLSGLQWKVVGAHPAGGLQQGFGAWSAPPEGTSNE